jgi:hypothetical protein
MASVFRGPDLEITGGTSLVVTADARGRFVGTALTTCLTRGGRRPCRSAVAGGGRTRAAMRLPGGR